MLSQPLQPLPTGLRNLSPKRTVKLGNGTPKKGPKRPGHYHQSPVPASSTGEIYTPAGRQGIFFDACQLVLLLETHTLTNKFTKEELEGDQQVNCRQTSFRTSPNEHPPPHASHDIALAHVPLPIQRLEPMGGPVQDVIATSASRPDPQLPLQWKQGYTPNASFRSMPQL